MKRLARLTLSLVALGACAHAAGTTTATATSPTTSSDEAELMALDRAWIDAEVHHDKAALERILDERFLATFASGRTVDRTSFIESIMKATISPFEVIHDVIRVHEDTALVIDLALDRKAKYTWIAVKRQGQWRVISETFTSVTTPTE